MTVDEVIAIASALATDNTRLRGEVTRLQLDAAKWRWFIRSMPSNAGGVTRLMPSDADVIEAAETEEPT